jgi:hypothetical protein
MRCSGGHDCICPARAAPSSNTASREGMVRDFPTQWPRVRGEGLYIYSFTKILTNFEKIYKPFAFNRVFSLDKSDNDEDENQEDSQKRGREG